MSLDHKEHDLTWKLAVITDKYGLRFFMTIISLPKLDKNEASSSLFWKGEMQSFCCCCNSLLKEAPY